MKLKVLLIPCGTVCLLALNHTFAPLWTVIGQLINKNLIAAGKIPLPRIFNSVVLGFYSHCIKTAIRWHSILTMNMDRFIRPQSERNQIVPVVPGLAESRINEAQVKAKENHNDTLEKTLNSAHTEDDPNFFTRTMTEVENNFRLIFGSMYDTVSYPFRIVGSTIQLVGSSVRFIYNTFTFSRFITGFILFGTGCALLGTINYSSVAFLGLNPILIVYGVIAKPVISYFVGIHFPTSIPRAISTIPTTSIPVSTPETMTVIQRILTFIADKLIKSAERIKDLTKEKKN